VRGPFWIPHVNRAGEALLDVLVSCELRAVLSYFEKRARKDFRVLADNFAAAYGTCRVTGFIQELSGGLYRCGSERPVCCAYDTLPVWQFPSMVAHSLPPGHPGHGTEFAPLEYWMLHLNVLQRSTLRW
jgi:hypothetical protein